VVAAQLNGVVWLTVLSETDTPADILVLDADLDLLAWLAIDGGIRLGTG
jgi:hypothetical protein